MTAQEAIAQADRIRPNHYDTDVKLKWLSDLDAQIYSEVILTHEDADVLSPPGALTVKEVDFEARRITVHERLDAAQAISLIFRHPVIRGVTYAIEEADPGKQGAANFKVGFLVPEEDDRAPRQGDEVLFTDEWITGLDSKLLVPPPYDRMYLIYLFSQIDFHNAEIARYNNDTAMFAAAYQDFAGWYNRRHMPLQKKVVLP